MNLIYYIKIFIILISFPCFIFSESLSTSGELLRTGMGGRNAGMAEATSAIVNDVEAMYVNKAGLALIKHSQVFFEHALLIDSINYDTVSLVLPTTLFHGAFGVNIEYLYLAPFYHYNDWGDEIKEINFNNFKSDIGTGITILKNNNVQLNTGIGLFYLRQALDNKVITQAAMDLGFMVSYFHHFIFINKILGPSLNLAVVLQNMEITKSKENEQLPFLYKTGIGFSIINQINMDLEILKYIDSPTSFNTGIEYTFKKLLSLRAGLKLGAQELDLFTTGIGVKTRIAKHEISFDYALTPLSYGLGYTHRFSVKINLTF